MLLYNALHIIRSHIVIPDAVGVDNDKRTVAAQAETAGFVDFDGFVNPFLHELFFEFLHDIFHILIIAVLAAAEEQVLLQHLESHIHT
ncbi:hypothetical protein D3C85_1759880 [compost metagenome]